MEATEVGEDVYCVSNGSIGVCRATRFRIGLSKKRGEGRLERQFSGQFERFKYDLGDGIFIRNSKRGCHRVGKLSLHQSGGANTIMTCPRLIPLKPTNPSTFLGSSSSSFQYQLLANNTTIIVLFSVMIFHGAMPGGSDAACGA